jgi:uncharacterized protein YbaA (DUF1428 family)
LKINVMKKNLPSLASNLLIAILLAMALSPSLAGAAETDTRCFELRTYYANEGKLDGLHARFRDHTVALFEKHGMTNVGYWVPLDNAENKLVYLLAYPSRAARGKAWKGFLGDPAWKAAYQTSIADGKLVKRVESVFLKSAEYSMFSKSSVASPERLFELRTYTTNPGKLAGLHARFRDHTVELFTQHGIQNVGYWIPINEDKGRDNKLVYLIAHKSIEGRAAARKAFSKDPRWKSARDASEADGKLLIKGGVQSLTLKPTDYSPMK